jgi:hypothetical protein
LLAKLGFFDGAIHHVANNFNFGGQRHLKHFISFSENRDTAVRYAHGSGATSVYVESVNNSCMYVDMTGPLVGGSFESECWMYTEHIILQSKDNSQRDQEWLILVLDLIPEQKGLPPSSSGLVSHGDPLSIEFFIQPEYLDLGGSAFMDM